MTTRRLTINLPAPLWVAVYAEASRCYLTPSHLVVEVLTAAFPEQVAQRLRADLGEASAPGGPDGRG